MQDIFLHLKYNVAHDLKQTIKVIYNRANITLNDNIKKKINFDFEESRESSELQTKLQQLRTCITHTKHLLKACG